MRLISPSIEPWMTRETESKSALRWTNLDNAERIERESGDRNRGKKKRKKKKTRTGGELHTKIHE